MIEGNVKGLKKEAGQQLRELQVIRSHREHEDGWA